VRGVAPRRQGRVFRRLWRPARGPGMLCVNDKCCGGGCLQAEVYADQMGCAGYC
jgi:hypothetical protein